MKFERTEVWGFEGALRGMRNPKASWHLSDSGWRKECLDFGGLCNKKCEYDQCLNKDGFLKEYVIGPKDMKLAQTLIRGGSEHRKFLRQIFVSVDITAPQFWWAEFDTYKIGTTANSTSKMHKLAETPITLDCFEIDDYDPKVTTADYVPIGMKVDNLITFLEQLRLKYLETKDKRYWLELVRWLPESWLQTRTVTMNYENILNMCHQRKYHKLNYWSGKDDPTKPNFISWARSLPCAQELIFLDELDGAVKDLTTSK